MMFTKVNCSLSFLAKKYPYSASEANRRQCNIIINSLSLPNYQLPKIALILALTNFSLRKDVTMFILPQFLL